MNPKAKSKPQGELTPKSKRGGARPGAGRPRRSTLSEKEILEKARSMGRRSLVDVMQGWLDDLNAEKGIAVGNGEYARIEYVPDFAARQNARKEIADRCGFRFDPNDTPSDAGRAMLELLQRLDSSAKPDAG